MNNGAAAAPPEIDLAADNAIIHLLYRDSTGALHTDVSRARLEEALRDRSGLVWVDIQGPDDGASRRVEDWLSEVFRFHPLAIEDALRETHVPRVDDWGAYLYLVFQVPRLEARSDVLV